MTTHMTHPIDKVQWVHRDMLQANGWNPNHVAPPEMALLKISILEDGWATAIVVQEVWADDRDDPPIVDHYEIIDGFHRWTVAGDPEVAAMTGSLVPITVVTADPAHARISTIRFNRARGSHGVRPMGDIVSDLLDEFAVPTEEIQRRLGMDREEVARLHRRRVVDRRATDTLSGAWRPKPLPTAP